MLPTAPGILKILDKTQGQQGTYYLCTLIVLHYKTKKFREFMFLAFWKPSKIGQGTYY